MQVFAQPHPNQQSASVPGTGGPGTGGSAPGGVPGSNAPPGQQPIPDIGSMVNSLLGGLPQQGSQAAAGAPGQANPLGAFMTQLMSGMNQVPVGPRTGATHDPRQSAPTTSTPTPTPTSTPTPTPTSQPNNREVTSRAPAPVAATLPPQWQSVIAQDKQKQSLNSTQRPFSDAYLEGQPLSKRRKTNEINSVSLEKRLERSIQKTPNTSTFFPFPREKNLL